MRICFLMSALFSAGGEQRVVTTLANEMCVENEITIVSFGDKNKEPYYYLQPDINVINLPEVNYSFIQKVINIVNRKSTLLCKWTRILEYAYIPNSFLKQLKEVVADEYDVVVGVAGLYSIFLGYIADELRAVTIGWEHNSYEAYFRLPQKYYWHYDNVFKKCVGQLNRCIVLNEKIALKYQEELGIDAQIIYNPRSFECDEKSKLENKYFIATGRFTDQKGFDYLIEAFRLFAEQNSEWKLRILGDGDLRESIEEKIVNYGIQNRVELLGFQKDVKPYLLESSVFVLSSRWEGFPMSVTEALEIGLPIVSFNIDAISPLVDNEKEGIVVAKYDCKQMANAMLRLAESKELRKVMAENGIKKAQTLSIDNIVGQWKELLKKGE